MLTQYGTRFIGCLGKKHENHGAGGMAIGMADCVRLSNIGHDVLVVDNYLGEHSFQHWVRFLQDVPFLKNASKSGTSR